MLALRPECLHACMPAGPLLLACGLVYTLASTFGVIVYTGTSVLTSVGLYLSSLVGHSLVIGLCIEPLWEKTRWQQAGC